MATKDYMLSTIDNPFNPFTQFDSWLNFDIEKGYNTCALMARIARTSEQLSDFENDDEIDRAVEEIIGYDFMHLYIKVYKNDVIVPATAPVD